MAGTVGICRFKTHPPLTGLLLCVFLCFVLPVFNVCAYSRRIISKNVGDLYRTVPCDVPLSGETAPPLDWEVRRRLAILLNT